MRALNVVNKMDAFFVYVQTDDGDIREYVVENAFTPDKRRVTVNHILGVAEMQA